MTNAPARTLCGWTDLIEAVPTLLGFHPTDSIVLVAIVRGVLVATVRSDLPEGDPLPIIRGLAPLWRRFVDADLVLIAFTTDLARGWWALDEVDAALPAGRYRTLLLADGSHWWRAPAGPATAYDALASIHLARAAWEGRAVHRTRQELEALIEPVHTPAEVTESLNRVADRTRRLHDLIEDGLTLVAAHDDAPGDLDLDDATLLCLASHDERFLDAVMLSTTEQNADLRTSLWLQVVRSSVPNCAGFALAALSLAAWQAGNGALHSISLQAMVGRRGSQRWSGFLGRINAEALDPQCWPRLRDELRAAWPQTAAAGP